MIRKLFLIFALLSFLGILPARTLAQPAKTYESIREKYMKLRNTDRQITKRSEWESVLSQLSGFVDNFPASPEASSALMHAAIMNEEIYKRYGEDRYLDRAVAAFSRLTAQYRNSDSADDALFRLAELYLTEKKDVARAESYFERIIEDYPESDMAEAARIKLRKLNDLDQREEQAGTKDELKRNGRVVVLDPGHGGEDFGAVGVGGLYEKDVTLLVALEAKRLLEAKGNVVVRLTRAKDEFVPLMDRTSFANDFEAEIFVSLHLNASPSKQLSGFEVYYLDNTGDKASKALAERENASIQYEGAQADIQYMLSDLIQNVKLEDSIRLAEIVKRAVLQQLLASGHTVRDLGVKKAPFYVLVGAHMPCVLVEMSFIDHNVEGANVGKKEYRAALARGITQGISAFLGL